MMRKHQFIHKNERSKNGLRVILNGEHASELQPYGPRELKDKLS